MKPCCIRDRGEPRWQKMSGCTAMQSMAGRAIEPGSPMTESGKDSTSVPPVSKCASIMPVNARLI